MHELFYYYFDAADGMFASCKIFIQPERRSETEIVVFCGQQNRFMNISLRHTNSFFQTAI